MRSLRDRHLVCDTRNQQNIARHRGNTAHHKSFGFRCVHRPKRPPSHLRLSLSANEGLHQRHPRPCLEVYRKSHKPPVDYVCTRLSWRREHTHYLRTREQISIAAPVGATVWGAAWSKYTIGAGKLTTAVDKIRPGARREKNVSLGRQMYRAKRKPGGAMNRPARGCANEI